MNTNVTQRRGNAAETPKIGLIAGYIISIALTVTFLTAWPFNTLFFVLSLIAALSFQLRLGWANIPIDRTSVITMWSIFCFGLLGTIMQSIPLNRTIVGVLVAGLVFIELYCYIPLLSYYLHFTDVKEGEDSNFKRTTENGCIVSMFLYAAMLMSSMIYDSNIDEYEENLRLERALNNKNFVSVKYIGQESYEGTSYYILEAKGEKFYVSPFSHPEVRDIHQDTKVRYILGTVNPNYHLKEAMKIEFKN